MNRDALRKEMLAKRGQLVRIGFDAWFKKIHEGRTVPAVEHEEKRRAFYSGFSECFAFTSQSADLLSDDEAVSVLDSVYTELEMFARTLGQEPSQQ